MASVRGCLARSLVLLVFRSERCGSALLSSSVRGDGCSCREGSKSEVQQVLD